MKNDVSLIQQSFPHDLFFLGCVHIFIRFHYNPRREIIMSLNNDECRVNLMILATTSTVKVSRVLYHKYDQLVNAFVIYSVY